VRRIVIGMNLLAALLDLVLPRRCAGCGSPLGALCPSCVPRQPVQRAAAGSWAAAVYDGATRAALLAYKERGRRDLAGPLALLLARGVCAALVAERSPPGVGVLVDVVLIPVPSARSAAAARGGNHVLRLARRAAARCGVRVAGDVLALTRTVRDSTGLGPQARTANLAGAMTARPPRRLGAAVIVDDIVTTGATLREARRALHAAGWQVLGAAVVAATPRRAGELAGPLAAPRNTV
jgi:predicted amidophosphoribosyltransferase